MSTRPRLLLTRRFPESVEQRALQVYDTAIRTDDEPNTPARICKDAAGHDAILCCAVDPMKAETIDALPDSVKAIATFSVGVDHFDLDAARRRGVTVTNTPDVLTDATAEIAMLLIVGAARRGAEGDRMIRENAWTGWTPTQLLGVELVGKRLGIIGLGRIGRAVARRARAFGMSIHYSGRRRIAPDLEGDAIFHDSVESLLAVSDVLSLHCPATPETTGLINAARLRMLPPGAILVNTARGPIVDDEALIAALRDGTIRAAGLDVFTGEPDVHPGYRDLPNTFLLPHLGSATAETRQAMGFRALDNLDAFFAGKEPRDKVV